MTFEHINTEGPEERKVLYNVLLARLVARGLVTVLPSSYAM